MKKFLTISMMALALVFATSCEKDNEESLDNYVNTWVTEQIPASEVVGDEFNALIAKLPEDAQKMIASQMGNLSFKAALVLNEDGKAQAGIVVEKAKLNLLATAVETMLDRYSSQIPAEYLQTIQQILPVLKQFVASLEDNDLVGESFTYSATPTDATSGKFVFTFKDLDENGKPKDEIINADYSSLSESSMKIEVTEEGETISYTFKSASVANVKLGKFVDIEQALNSLMPQA